MSEPKQSELEKARKIVKHFSGRIDWMLRNGHPMPAMTFRQELETTFASALSQAKLEGIAEGRNQRISEVEKKIKDFFQEREMNLLADLSLRKQESYNKGVAEGRRESPKPDGFKWVGHRVRIKKTFLGAGRLGTVLAEPVGVEQFWLAVKWDDEEDPDFFKKVGVEIVGSEGIVE